MASRFPPLKTENASKGSSEDVSMGARSPSSLRMRTSVSCGHLPGPASLPSSPGSPMSSSKRRHSMDFSDRPQSPAKIAASSMFTAKGQVEEEYCIDCGGLMRASGRGLKLCTECRLLTYASGLASRLASGDPQKPSEEEAAILRANEDRLSKGLMQRKAWRRASAAAIAEMRKDKTSWGASPDNKTDENAEAEPPKPIMAGYVDTGYFVGNKVRTSVRLREAGEPWNPLKERTDEAYVIGPGNDAGEIMIRFAHNGVKASLKLSQIEHTSVKGPRNNIERDMRRMSNCVSVSCY